MPVSAPQDLAQRTSSQCRPAEFMWRLFLGTVAQAVVVFTWLVGTQRQYRTRVTVVLVDAAITLQPLSEWGAPMGQDNARHAQSARSIPQAGAGGFDHVTFDAWTWLGILAVTHAFDTIAMHLSFLRGHRRLQEYFEWQVNAILQHEAIPIAPRLNILRGQLKVNRIDR